MGGGCGARSETRRPAPKSEMIVCKAAMKYARKRAGLPSTSSSESQATRILGWHCSKPATHALASVVLPEPAGAEMRVSLRAKPWFWRKP